MDLNGTMCVVDESFTIFMEMCLNYLWMKVYQMNENYFEWLNLNKKKRRESERIWIWIEIGLCIFLSHDLCICLEIDNKE